MELERIKEYNRKNNGRHGLNKGWLPDEFLRKNSKPNRE